MNLSYQTILQKRWFSNLTNPIVLLFIAVLLGVAGQFLFKTGLNKMGGEIELSIHIARLFLTPYIASGLGCYVLSTFIWLAALSKVPLSFAYPMLSTGYLIIYFASILFLGEKYTHAKLAANILIILGISLLFWGKK
jgi:multidrug transporter EmrE-like cation transporter